ncbi:MAG TPA: hypothetical protein DDW65_16615 [Firmicutes bacterium]|jgi:hypothetical protein|nr:hypothetical protein [Bacillota bacterium]
MSVGAFIKRSDYRLMINRAVLDLLDSCSDEEQLISEGFLAYVQENSSSDQHYNIILKYGGYPDHIKI